MYQTGEYVTYGIHGVCRVVGKEKQLVNRKRMEYLILEPLGHSQSRFYLPTANENAMSKLSPVLGPTELDELLKSPQVRQFRWICEENVRKQYYRDLVSSGDRLSILRMIYSLYRYREEQFASGKKFHQCDDNFLRDAEKLMVSEICLALDKTPEEARNYLRETLG